jgi:pimeloyl-ACP methyl ester carboxylesterase
MAQFTHGDVTIHYEQSGDGYPVLLLAPGALESTIDAWVRAPINPLEAYAGVFRLIAMDQRNAGSSTGPFPIVDPWRAYVEDQLRLADHLGFEHFQMLGCCIGSSYALKMAELAPDRLAAAVLEQPIGVTEENRTHWIKTYRDFATRVVGDRPQLSAEDGEAFGAAMWEGGEFVISVTRESVRACQVPLLVLPGVDFGHPHGIGVEVAELAPRAELVDPWQDTPEHLAEATERVREFIARHAAG